MKRRLLARLLAAALTLSLFGCGAAQETPPSENSADEQASAEHSTPTNGPDFSHLVLTKEQMLEDYDSVWVAFEENSPFLNIYERRHGSGYLDSVARKYRQQIEEMELEGDDAMLEFLLIVSAAMSELYDVDGHASIFNSGWYRELRDAYIELVDEMPVLQPWVDVLDTPQTAAWYDYYDYLFANMMEEAERNAEPEGAEELLDEDLNQQAEPNLSTDIREDGRVAYIKVDSFAIPFMEEEIPQILAFLEEAKGCGHLIIDIRENGGGDVRYWEEAFVRPNLSEPVTTSVVRLMRDSSLATRFYSSNYEGSTLTVEDVKENPAFTALHLEDMDQLAFATELTDTTEPKVPGEAVFDGEIWLLVGPAVYSSAENFAVFCKATGFATLVGQTTGGGNTGGPVLHELPNSHQLVQFDVEYALNPDGSCSQEQGTVPDILADDALQAVLEIIRA